MKGQKNKGFLEFIIVLPMVIERNLCNVLILQAFQPVIDFLMHNAGLNRFLFSGFYLSRLGSIVVTLKHMILNVDILKDKKVKLFLILAAFFIGNTLVAEFIGVKIFSLEGTFGFDQFNWTVLGVEGLGMNLSAGVILWPVVFVMTDVINEYFGEKGVKVLSNIAVLIVLYGFVMIYGAIWLTPNEWWTSISGVQENNPQGSITNMDLAFQKIMGQGLWIIVGSMVAFLVGQIVDVMVFHKIRKITGEKKVWLRATGSTLVSQFIDSFVVLFVAFYIGADWELIRVLAIGIVNYSYKFMVAILLTPLIYLAHHWIDNYLGEELAEAMKSEAAG